MLYSFKRKKGQSSYEGALEPLFNDNYEKVYKTILSIALDAELAKEVVQEAFFKAYSKIDTLRDKGKFSQWVCTIAVNEYNDMLNKKIISRARDISLYDDEKNEKYIPELTETNTPEKIYEKKEISLIIKKCIGELNIEERQMITLKYYNKFTYAEMAEVMNVRESTLRVKMLRTRYKILNKLTKHLDLQEYEV